MKSKILVDTHIWLWHLNADVTLPSRIKKIIDVSAKNDELYLSAISIWEIAMLSRKGRIVLSPSCQVWINKSLSLPGASLIPLSPEIAIESCNLADTFHGDPADRILVASAKIENLCLISRDKKLTSYCIKQNIDVIEA